MVAISDFYVISEPSGSKEVNSIDNQKNKSGRASSGK
jgi:hypothetical protein